MEGRLPLDKMEGRLIPARAEDKVLAALPLILQQCTDSRVQLLLLCNLLQVSKSFRRAAQRSEVQCSVSLWVSEGSTVASFAAWLSRHAGLVGDVAAECNSWPLEDPFAQLFVLAVQNYKLSHPAFTAGGCTSSATSSCGPSTAIIKLSSLRLASMRFSGILQAIQPADSLTSLYFNGGQQHFTTGTLTALCSLKNLQELELTDNSGSHLPLQIYDAVGKMSQLTRLVVTGAQVSEASLQQLPPSLQALTLHGRHRMQPPGSHPGRLSLQHLVALRELGWCWPKQDTAVQLMLPQQLTRVLLAGSVHAELPPGVLYASIVNPEDCLPVVRNLLRMPVLRGLQDLLLGCADDGGWERSELRASQAQELVSVLGSLQQLTFLHVNCSGWVEGWSTEVQLGAALQHLQALKHLHLQHAELTEADVLLLSCMTHLTHLGLPDGGAGVTGLAVAALACELTRLVCLDISGCGLHCTTVVPVLGRLTLLRQLNLHGNRVSLNDLSLSLLTGLRELTSMSIPCQHNISDQGMASFLAALPCLHEVDDGLDKDVPTPQHITGPVYDNEYDMYSD